MEVGVTATTVTVRDTWRVTALTRREEEEGVVREGGTVVEIVVAMEAEIAVRLVLDPVIEVTEVAAVSRDLAVRTTRVVVLTAADLSQ